MNWKIVRKVVGYALAISALVVVGYLLVAFYAFHSAMSPKYVERARFPATDPDGVDVYIVRVKDEVEDNPLFVWANVDGISVTWSDDENVLIQAEHARVYGPRDYSIQEDVRVGAKTVHVRYEIKDLERR